MFSNKLLFTRATVEWIQIFVDMEKSTNRSFFCNILIKLLSRSFRFRISKPFASASVKFIAPRRRVSGVALPFALSLHAQKCGAMVVWTSTTSNESSLVCSLSKFDCMGEWGLSFVSQVIMRFKIFPQHSASWKLFLKEFCINLLEEFLLHINNKILKLSAGFYKSCVTRINILMNDDSEPMALQSSRPLVTNCQHIHLASCLLLRGLFNIAAGHMIEGLEDLHETSKEDYRMFPRRCAKLLNAFV